MFERKTLTLGDIKATGDGTGSFEGYASVFGGVDSYGDTIEHGAYKATIKNFLTNGVIAWGHDITQMVATPRALAEDDRGLVLKADFHSDPESQRKRTITMERIERGKSMGLSIGYEAEEWEFRKSDNPVRNAWGELTDEVRVLKKIKLYEISLVAIPADDAARVVGAKETYRLTEEEALVRAHVPSLLGRWRSIVALESGESKAGAAISRARRERLASLRDVLRGGADELDGLLKEVEPQSAAEEEDEKAAPPADTVALEPSPLLSLYQQFMREERHFAAVLTGRE